MANDACSRILGCEHSDLFARTTEEVGLWPNDDRETFVAGLRVGEEAPTREVRLETPDGPRWIEVRFELISLGGHAHAITTLHDITDRVLAELALRAERDHYAALVAALQDGYYVISPTGRVVEVNDRFCALVGMSREAALEVVAPGPWWPADVVP